MSFRKPQESERAMTTPTSQLILLTDARGSRMPDIEDTSEPLPGSIIMTEGMHGTAWQRWFTDGLWHRTGSTQKKDWAYLLAKRNVVLVYDADEREAV